MKKVRLALFFTFISFGTCFSFTSQAQLTTQEIIEKNIEAQGGRALLQTVQTTRSEYKTTMDGRQVTFVIKEMLPNKGSFEIVYQGRTVYKSFFDGQQGYELQNGTKVAEKPEVYKDKHFKKNIFNELDYLDTALYTIELLGEDKVGKEPVYKIKVTLRNGSEKIIYYSRESFLEVKSERIKLAESGRSDVTLAQKHKKIKGIMYAGLLIFDAGTKSEQKASLEELYINEQVSEADFN